MAKKQEQRDYYEIRQGKDVLCGSSVPFLGYPMSWFCAMYKQGLACYKNGKRVKLCDITVT